MASLTENEDALDRLEGANTFDIYAESENQITLYIRSNFK